MITFEEAEKIAKDKIPSNHVIVQIVEKTYGWYFISQNNEYLRTKNNFYLEAGSGGFIIEKESGEVVEFGSIYSQEKNFEIYEKGFAYKNYDLTVLEVKDLNLAVKLLKKLSMRFVEPEVAYGVEWKVPQEYSEKQLKQILQKLPFTFSNQNFYSRHQEFEDMKNSNCLEYELTVVEK